MPKCQPPHLLITASNMGSFHECIVAMKFTWSQNLTSAHVGLYPCQHTGLPVVCVTQKAEGWY